MDTRPKVEREGTTAKLPTHEYYEKPAISLTTCQTQQRTAVPTEFVAPSLRIQSFMEMHENLEKLVMCEGNISWNNNVQCMAFNGCRWWIYTLSESARMGVIEDKQRSSP